MNDVNNWLEILVMVVAISGLTIASVVGALVGLWKRVDRRLDTRIRGVAGSAIEAVVESRLEPRLDRIETRLDRVEGRLDRVELRLEHLEGDMTIVKQRLIGVA